MGDGDWRRRRVTGNQHGVAASNHAAGPQRATQFWSIAFAVGALLVVIGFAGFWLRSHRREPVVADPHRLPTNENVIYRFESPSEDDALALVREAIDNRDPRLVSSSMRLGETDPAEAIAFMEGLAAREGRIGRVAWLSSLDVGGMPVESLVVVREGESSRSERLAFLVPDDGGVWKMDFEAFARACRPSWKDFIAKRLEGSRVRVVVAADSYYNGPFRDDRTWECFALMAPELKELLPEGKESLRGYCRRESPQAKALMRILEGDARMKRATLEIQRVPDAGPREFEITRVLSEDWVLPARPFDEQFD